MSNKIFILTTTRADYGILKPLIKACFKEETFDTTLLVTGTHLSKEFGETYQEIEAEQYPSVKLLPITLQSNTSSEITTSMADVLHVFGAYFVHNKPDLLLVLGDRYETLAVCIAAMTAQIPIAHLHGGELTEGAIDEAIRHSITKMSYLHFTSTERYQKRVIQLGEDPSRVFHVGALGIDNIKHTPLLSKEVLSTSLGIQLLQPYALVTFHPVTLDTHSALEQLEEILAALERHPNITFLFTYANADKDGALLNRRIKEYCDTRENAFVYPSLGMIRYLSACQYASFVLGNSSSGILEVPSFCIPTINIGDRQNGRIQAKSIINCLPTASSINSAIIQAMDPTFLHNIQDIVNPYGDGNTTDRILTILKDLLPSLKLSNLKKAFYDL